MTAQLRFIGVCLGAVLTIGCDGGARGRSTMSDSSNVWLRSSRAWRRTAESSSREADFAPSAFLIASRTDGRQRQGRSSALKSEPSHVFRFKVEARAWLRGRR